MLKKNMKAAVIDEIRLCLKCMFNNNVDGISKAFYNSAEGAIDLAVRLELITEKEGDMFKKSAWNLYCEIRWEGLTKWEDWKEADKWV